MEAWPRQAPPAVNGKESPSEGSGWEEGSSLRSGQQTFQLQPPRGPLLAGLSIPVSSMSIWFLEAKSELRTTGLPEFPDLSSFPHALSSLLFPVSSQQLTLQSQVALYSLEVCRGLLGAGLSAGSLPESQARVEELLDSIDVSYSCLGVGGFWPQLLVKDGLKGLVLLCCCWRAS